MITEVSEAELPLILELQRAAFRQEAEHVKDPFIKPITQTLAALREIEGVGEATCRKYGPEVLSLIPGRNKETPGEEVKNQ